MRLWCLLLLGGLAEVGAANGAALKGAGEFALPGPVGKRFDYLTVEAGRNVLLSSHMSAGELYVIDLKTNAILGTVTGVPFVEGVECVPELDKVYCSNAGDDSIAVVDLKKMVVVKRLKTEGKPDGSTYAAPFHRLYVSDEKGKAVAVVDVLKDEIVKTLHFDSETGMPQYDPVAKRVRQCGARTTGGASVYLERPPRPARRTPPSLRSGARCRTACQHEPPVAEDDCLRGSGPTLRLHGRELAVVG